MAERDSWENITLGQPVYLRTDPSNSWASSSP